MFAANSEQPGQRRPTRCIVPAFGHGDQAFALSPVSWQPWAHVGRLFIGLVTPHLAKNALALQLLFEDSERLIDIVVANEYPQMFSDRAAAVLCAVEMS